MDTRLLTLGYLELEELLVLHSDDINLCNQTYKIYHNHRKTLEDHIQYDEFLSVKYLISIGHQLDQEYINIAAKRGNLQMVKYFISLCVSVTQKTIHFAILSGNIELIKYLSNRICINPNNIRFSLDYGTPDVCKLLYDLGLVYIIDIIRLGGFHILKYFVSHGLVLTDEMLKIATCENNLEMVEYLYNQGCKLSSPSELMNLSRSIIPGILEFYKKVGYIK